MEQGFTLHAPPPGSRTRPVVVELASTGALRPTIDPATASILFEAPGATALRYGGLHVYDASGRLLGSRLALAGTTITLTVDDAGAAYPLTIDPLISTHHRLR